MLIPTEATAFSRDISFKTCEELGICKRNSTGYWDEDELCIVAEEIQTMQLRICHGEFYPILYCGGVFVISKRNQITNI